MPSNLNLSSLSSMQGIRFSDGIGNLNVALHQSAPFCASRQRFRGPRMVMAVPSRQPETPSSDGQSEVVDKGDITLSTSPSLPADAFSGPFSTMTLARPEHPFAIQQRRGKKVPMTEEEKRVAMEEARRHIAEDIQRRESLARARQVATGLESELKFARLLATQGEFEKALPHFQKVKLRTRADLLQHGQAVLGTAQCLQKLGREDEAWGLYRSVIYHRYPFPHIRRQAEAALRGAPIDSDADTKPPPSVFEDYLNRTNSIGSYSSWYNKDRREETQAEKALMFIMPSSLLLMGPILLFYMIYVAKFQ